MVWEGCGGVQRDWQRGGWQRGGVQRGWQRDGVQRGWQQGWARCGGGGTGGGWKPFAICCGICDVCTEYIIVFMHEMKYILYIVWWIVDRGHVTCETTQLVEHVTEYLTQKENCLVPFLLARKRAVI